jgi:hypothetical protein
MYADSEEGRMYAARDAGAAAGRAARQKQIDLAASAGAGILGAGVSVLLDTWLHGAAVPLVVIGAALHGWGMLARHQAERRAGAALPHWSLALYWSCWIALLALGGYLVLR